ncbi:TrmB family transcriptional regulator, partial [Streptomyces griseoruber]|uniref:TrmB family transcriptional regulator n=1 Tax=Streptomyces griseoruber TaxID=1943 RepID=UPI0006E37021
MLDLLGLDSAAEAVYREMLAHPDEGVAELAARLGLSESVFRKALDCLTELTLVRTSLEAPGQIRAVSPQLGMEILLAHQQAELAAHQHRVEASRAAAAKLISEYAHQVSAAHESTTVYLRGVEAVRDYLAVLNAQVREEFLTLAPGGPQTPANMKASRPLNQRLLDRGIRMRTVYLDSIRRDAVTMAHAEWITQRGGQVRTIAVLPTRVIICDRKVAIIAADSDDTS